MEHIKNFKDQQPDPDWFKLNEEFGSDYIPFHRLLDIAEQLFDEFRFVDEKIQIINNIVIVSIGLEVVWQYPFKRSVGVASMQLKRRNANEYNKVSAATHPSITLSVAMKNAMQKLCEVMGRTKDVPDEGSPEIKEDKKFLN